MSKVKGASCPAKAPLVTLSGSPAVSRPSERAVRDAESGLCKVSEPSRKKLHSVVENWDGVRTDCLNVLNTDSAQPTIVL